jgi:protein SDA1
LAMTPTLLKDLIQYKNHKEKGVAMGAKSLVTLFRILNPAILPKKYRAKGLDMSVKPQAYGAVDVKDHLEGTELLDQYDSLMEDSDDDDMSGSDDDMDVDSNDEWESASGSDLDGEEDLAGGEWESVSDDESGAGSADEEDGEEESGEEGMISGDEMDEDEESDEEGSVDEFRSRSDVSSDDDGEVGADEIEEPSASDAKSTGTSNTSRVESLRILDDEDLRRLAILREKRHELEAMSAQRKKNKKRARDEMTSNLEEARERDVNPEDLEGPQKRTKMDREARIEHAKESRDEIKAERGDKRQDKKSRFKTNKEKNKTKLFKMVQYSDRVRSKKNLTVKEKVARRGKHLENVKKLDKSKKSKILKR